MGCGQHVIDFYVRVAVASNGKAFCSGSWPLTCIYGCKVTTNEQQIENVDVEEASAFEIVP